MNIPVPYTPLESLILFRGIGKYGLDESAFEAISDGLRNNALIKDDPSYNPERLTSVSLRDLFLDLLWEELKVGIGDAAPRPDGGSPPASKKRRLQAPPRPTVQDAARLINKIKSGHDRLQDIYIRQMVAAVQLLEEEYLEVQEHIRALEAPAQDGVAQVTGREKQLRGDRPGVGRTSNLGDGARNSLEPVSQPSPGLANIPNGIGPSPAPSMPSRPLSPQPPPLPQAPSLPSTPLLVGAPKKEGPQLPPQIQPAANQPKPTPAPPAPVLAQPQAAPPSLGPHGLPQVPADRAQDATKPSSGLSPGLQLPQGLPLFQPAPLPSQSLSPAPPLPADGLQRPPEVSRPKQAPVPSLINSQTTVQGQLRWEPPYQPNTPSPRLAAGTNILQPGEAVIQFPQGPVQQRIPGQHPPQTIPRPLQPQSVKPVPQPGLVPPQNATQYPPALQPAPIRPSTESSGPAQNRQQLLAPNVQPNRAPPPVFHGYAQPPQARPAGSSPTPPAVVAPRSHPSLAQPQPPRLSPQNLQAPPAYAQSGPSPVPTPLGLAQPETQRGYTSPYPAQRPVVPDRVQQQRLPSTPTPALPARLTPLPFPPQTPALFLPRLITGSGTKWSTTSTPSTPTAGPLARLVDDVPDSPAFEPLSPARPPQTLPQGGPGLDTSQGEKRTAYSPEQPIGSPHAKRKAGRPRGSQRGQDAISSPKPTMPALSIPRVSIPSASSSQAPLELIPAVSDTPQLAKEPESATIKDEVTTPLPLTEAGDTTADESVTGRRQATRQAKRKREELSPTPVQTPVGDPPSFFEPDVPQPVEQAPTTVLWTRGFNKVSGSAIEQIVRHRHANMFAAPIRERDAPGYHKVVLQSQDLKSIKAAISFGNRTAAQAAAALPEGDSNKNSVKLPINESLLPPKSIINSGQLDRELAHMFANAIMYNPDAGHGPGPEFLVETDEFQGDGQEGGPQEGALGYKVDEFGVVNDARAMFTEVEKLLSELRSAEVRRTGGGRAGATTTGTSTRQASVAHREASQAGDDGTIGNNHDDADEQTATEPETGTAKRRRTTRG